MDDKLCVFLWSPPRSLSTAFEFSIRQIPRVKCYHELFVPAYTHGPERSTSEGNPFKHLPIDSTKTYDAAMRELEMSLESTEYEAIFVKAMALTIYDHRDLLLRDSIRYARHTFIIRHPVWALLSGYNRLASINLPFEVNTDRYESTFHLHQFIKDDPSLQDPVVLDADDLLRDPDKMMEQYCKATGLTYIPNMGTKWSKTFTFESMGAHPLTCVGAHDVALNSTGITKREVPKPLPADSELPEAVRKSVELQMPYYDALKSVCLKL